MYNYCQLSSFGPNTTERMHNVNEVLFMIILMQTYNYRDKKQQSSKHESNRSNTYCTITNHHSQLYTTQPTMKPYNEITTIKIVKYKVKLKLQMIHYNPNKTLTNQITLYTKFGPNFYNCMHIVLY